MNLFIHDGIKDSHDWTSPKPSVNARKHFTVWEDDEHKDVEFSGMGATGLTVLVQTLDEKTIVEADNRERILDLIEYLTTPSPVGAGANIHIKDGSEFTAMHYLRQMRDEAKDDAVIAAIDAIQ